MVVFRIDFGRDSLGEIAVVTDISVGVGVSFVCRLFDERTLLARLVD